MKLLLIHTSSDMDIHLDQETHQLITVKVYILMITEE